MTLTNISHLIQINNISKSVKTKNLFNDFSCAPNDGEFISIIGPSGCGKSSLLKLIAKLDSPDKGEITYNKNTKISFVFQDPALIPWLNVAENIKLALGSSFSPSETSDKVSNILNLVKLSGSEKLFPFELSGGMKMRVSIARALVNEPQLLLLDEPFSALDELVRFELQEDLLSFWKDKKMNIFFVTHAISEAVFLSQKILVFNKSTIETHDVTLPEVRTEPLRVDPTYLDQIAVFSRRIKSYA
jgi:NitT/TauT family transport system ATP-binding protein